MQNVANFLHPIYCNPTLRKLPKTLPQRLYLFEIFTLPSTFYPPTPYPYPFYPLPIYLICDLIDTSLVYFIPPELGKDFAYYYYFYDDDVYDEYEGCLLQMTVLLLKQSSWHPVQPVSQDQSRA